jgi:hypothetical protein
MSDRKIKYVVSLGSLCHTSNNLNILQLKKFSCPFDWVFSNLSIIKSCIEDDFKTYLDKNNYITINDHQCGHKIYGANFFWHHNPLLHEDKYNYFNRCVERFRNVLHSEENKLFVVTRVNLESFEEDLTEYIQFNELFLQRVSNYKILIINTKCTNKNLDHTLEIPGSQCIYNDNNLIIYNLLTDSLSDGINFINPIDNLNYQAIIQSFDYDVINIS